MVLKEKKSNFGIILAVYLLGIFMGALDTGIVSPARTIIQNSLGVDEKSGIWMITIYTLAYAASIPIMGKLADKFGRKYIYLLSIFLFGLGSLFCGLSESFASFPLLLAARAVQAIGGGGILPVATAEFGTTFPKEKRGMALGLVGGVFGIANIFGASAGSAIIDLFGANNWQYIFYINVPITLFILVAGFLSLPNTRSNQTRPIDIGGIFILTIMVLSLMYGLKGIDFFAFKATLTDLSVYPFLLIFVVLTPIFILIERKAADPVINLAYFQNRQIVVTLLLAFMTGIIIIGMIFVPQFAENTLKIKSGSGGYLVLVLGLFAGVGAPFSGKLIDRIGVKIVLGFGFLISVIGSLFLILITVHNPNLFNVITSLVLIGLGIGFTMGTPLNYMMLENTRQEDSNSALATLSLIRSIGTAIAPAIMIGFIAHAGLSVQANVMQQLPSEITLPALPYAQQLTDTFRQLKSNPAMQDQLAGIDVPDLTAFQTIKIDMSASSDTKLPVDLIALLRSSDVTTIVDNSKTLADRLFAQMTPMITANINKGLDSGITGLNSGLTQIDAAIAAMQHIPGGPSQGLAGLKAVREQLATALSQMQTLQAAVPGALATGKANYLQEIENRRPAIEAAYQTSLNVGFKQVYLTVTIASILGLLILLFYRMRRRQAAA
jgi:EmrB/QacA subfamily drug resistance transporter